MMWTASLRSPQACLVIVATLAPLLGCNDNPLGKVPVSGTVTFRGQPLASGNIRFDLPDGQTTGQASGSLIKNGQFSMSVNQGLPPGKYVVRIFSVDENQIDTTVEQMPGMGPPPRVERIPRDWNLASDHTVEVKSGEPAEFSFAIP